MEKGLFLTFSGVDGCGKTSVAKALVERIRASGDKAVFVDLNTTPFGAATKRLIMETDDMSPEVEVGLFQAALQYNYDHIIKPAVDKGINVIHDRWIIDTYVYQKILKNSSIEPHMNVEDPDLCFILDLPVEIARERIEMRDEETNRFDDMDMKSHINIRKGFITMGNLLNNKANSRFIILDASKSIEAIVEAVYKLIGGE